MDETLEAENIERSSLKTTNPNHMSVIALETQTALLQIRSRVLTFCKNVISSQGIFYDYNDVQSTLVLIS